MGHHKEHEPAGTQDYKVGKDNQAEAAPTEAKEKTNGAHGAKSAGNGSDDFGGLRAQQERLMKRLHELKSASTDAWTELKSGAESAYGELRGSVQKVITRFETALHSDQNHQAK